MIIVLKIHSSIFRDSYTEGELDDTGCGLPHTPIAEEFNTMKGAIEHIGKMYGYSTDLNDWDIDNDQRLAFTSRMVADHSDSQNGGWLDPTDSEMESWKKGDIDLYSENVVLSFRECH